jgi:hypothetical protein
VTALMPSPIEANPMTKLNDTQLVILNRAAQREDLGVAEIDKRATTKGAIIALLKSRHLKLVPRIADLALWDRNDEGQPLGLAVTPKALKLLGMDEDAPSPADTGNTGGRKARKTKTASVSREKSAPPRAAGTKLESVIKLLRRTKGATLAELMTATGWQVHSVRGVIAGAIKKKLGLAVLSEKSGETRTYRIAA